MPKIHFRLNRRTGQVTQTVIGGQGSSCMELTAPFEKRLGAVEGETKLPEYDGLEETQDANQDQNQA